MKPPTLLEYFGDLRNTDEGMLSLMALKRVETDRIGRVGGVNYDHLVAQVSVRSLFFGGNKREDRGSQFAVDIEDEESPTSCDVLLAKRADQRRLAGASAPEKRDMGRAARMRDRDFCARYRFVHDAETD